MPELPEVETLVQDLIASSLIGSNIVGISLSWERTIALPTPDEFSKRLLNTKLKKIYRRAKFIVFSFSQDEHLLVHLRMTGRFTLLHNSQESLPYERVRLLLSNNRALVYSDPRKFGRFYLVKNPEEILAKLGPEPLEKDFSVSKLAKKLSVTSRMIKPLLLDQTFLAGLGNIYVDEALWLAKIHPQTAANRLTKQEVELLFLSIQEALKRGLKASGTSLGRGKSNFYRLTGEQGSHQEWLQAFRQTGKPCPRCGHLIERLVVASRSTHICSRCQILK